MTAMASAIGPVSETISATGKSKEVGCDERDQDRAREQP